MIAPLRRRHRWMITLLAITVPALVVLAVSQRPDRDLQRVSSQAVPAGLPTQQQISNLFSQPPTSGRLWQEGDQAVLHVQTEEAPRLPDLLLYWTSSEPGASLPSDAVLLAPLPTQGDRVMPLPRATAGGHLLLYSLAHQELVESVALPTLDGPEPAEHAAESTDDATTDQTAADRSTP